MIHTDRSANVTPGGISINPGHALYEIYRGQAAAVLSAAGFVKQFDSGSIYTVLVEVVPQSAAYNLIKAV